MPCSQDVANENQPDSESHCGAPHGNSNATKSGVIAWVRHGGLPKSYKALRAELAGMGDCLASEVHRIKNRVPTLYEAAVIQSAVKHHGRLALLERWLAKECKTLALKERMDVLKEIGAAATSRDRALRELGINTDLADGKSIWEIASVPAAQ